MKKINEGLKINDINCDDLQALLTLHPLYNDTQNLFAKDYGNNIITLKNIVLAITSKKITIKFLIYLKPKNKK